MSAATNLPEPQAIPAAAVRSTPSTEFRLRLATISRQSAVYFAGTVLTAAAGFFFKIYLARALGAEGLGLYALGMSIVGFLGLFNAVGLPQAAARFVSEYRSRNEFERLGSFLRGSLGLLSAGNLLLGVIVLATGPWIAVHFYRAPALSPYFWLFVLIMFLGVTNTFFGQAMAGYQDIARRTVITHFIGTPVNIVIAVVLISAGMGLSGYLAAQVASALLVLGLLAISVWKMTPAEARHLRKPGTIEREVIAFSATAFGIATVDFMLSQADKIVLGRYLSASQVGVYAVAMALVAFVPIALQSVNQIFSPTIAELHATGKRELLQQLYATLTKWILIGTLPMAMAMIAFARALIGIFGHGFEAGATVLTIGAVGQLFNCAVGSVGNLLLMSGHQVQLIKIQACNAVALVAMSLILVPRFGIRGAAAASAVCVIGTNLWCLTTVHSKLRLHPYNSGYRKLLLPTLVCMLALIGLLRVSPGIHSPWVIAILGFGCAYATFLGSLLCLGLDPEDGKLAEVVCRKLGINSRLMGVTG